MGDIRLHALDSLEPLRADATAHSAERHAISVEPAAHIMVFPRGQHTLFKAMRRETMVERELHIVSPPRRSRCCETWRHWPGPDVEHRLRPKFHPEQPTPRRFSKRGPRLARQRSAFRHRGRAA